MNPTIFETVVYCGSRKCFRVLNINTGTVYSCEFETEKEAVHSIKTGEIRSGKIVKHISLTEILDSI